MSENVLLVLKELENIVGERYVSNQVEDLLPYCRDSFSPIAESLFGEPKMPLAVVCPADTQQVVETIKIANTHNLPILPVAFGSNMGGLAIPTVENTLILDLMRMNKIIEINEESMTATIQPAVSFGKLELEAQKHGLRTVCKVGGWAGGVIGNYISGNIRPFNARYGWTDPIVSLEIVLPNGELLRTGSAAMKGANTYSRLSWGPDLTALWRGSLGSFGIVTQAEIRLYPEGEKREFLTYEFGSLESMLRALREVQKNDIGVSALGGDSVFVFKIMLNPKDYGDLDAFDRIVDMIPQSSWFLLVESEGFAKRVEVEKEQTNLICKKHGGRPIRYEEERMKVLHDVVSHKGTYIMRHFNGAYVGIWCSLPFSKIPEFYKRIQPLFKRTFEFPGYPQKYSWPYWCALPCDRGTSWVFGWNITYIPSAPGNVEKIKEIIQITIATALQMGGTIPLTTHLLTEILMPSYANLLRQIKKAVDPKSILVPNKIC